MLLVRFHGAQEILASVRAGLAQRVHRAVAAIYGLHQAADKLGLLITEGPHKDTQDLQVPAFRWFNRWLKGGELRANIDRVLRILSELDIEGVPPSLKIFPLKYAAAQDIAKTLEAVGLAAVIIDTSSAPITLAGPASSGETSNRRAAPCRCETSTHAPRRRRYPLNRGGRTGSDRSAERLPGRSAR